MGSIFRFFDLNFLGAVFVSGCHSAEVKTMGHVRRQASLLPSNGTSARPRIPEMLGSLRRRLQIAGIFLPRSVLIHEFRAINFSRESARHRSLPAFGAREALSPWVPREHRPLHLGGRKRDPRLADLRRLRSSDDSYRPPE